MRALMWIRESALRAAVAFGFTMATMFVLLALLYLGPHGPLAVRDAALSWVGLWLVLAFFFYRGIKPSALAMRLDEQTERRPTDDSDRVKPHLMAEIEGSSPPPQPRRLALSHLSDRAVLWLIVGSGVSTASWVVNLVTGSQSQRSTTLALLLSIAAGSALLMERRRRQKSQPSRSWR